MTPPRWFQLRDAGQLLPRLFWWMGSTRPRAHARARLRGRQSKADQRDHRDGALSNRFVSHAIDTAAPKSGKLEFRPESSLKNGEFIRAELWSLMTTFRHPSRRWRVTSGSATGWHSRPCAGCRKTVGRSRCAPVMDLMAYRRRARARFAQEQTARRRRGSQAISVEADTHGHRTAPGTRRRCRTTAAARDHSEAWLSVDRTDRTGSPARASAGSRAGVRTKHSTQDRARGGSGCRHLAPRRRDLGLARQPRCVSGDDARGVALRQPGNRS